jgi:DNA modification methylase
MKNLKVEYVPIGALKASEYNPRKWNESQTAALKESIQRFGMVDPLVCNSATGRENIVVGGHFRLKVAKDMGLKEMPVVYVSIPEPERERELNVRLNKNLGEFDLDILKGFGEDFLKDLGFDTVELDEIFEVETTPEHFDLEHELKKLNINEITIKKGDMFDLDGSRLRCGDSMVEADMLALVDGEKIDFCFTDPPYILDYLHGKKKVGGKATEGFGLKRDRKYLGTDSLPENFSDLWMANVAKVQKKDFSIMIFEHPKNLRTIWNALEAHWKYRNTVVWHLPNRVQGFSAKYKFFSKFDVALVGTSGKVVLNEEPEDDPLFQEQYETALFATSGKPHWEGPGKGKKYCPTDFIEHNAGDKKSSGQEIIFGTKPIEILIPYLKVLTKRGDLVLEPFGGSGSTLIASTKLGRRCYVMEKSEVYTTVIIARWEKVTGKKAKKIS